MKEQAIQKINKVGKISSIIALIAKILVGIGIVVTLLGAIICFVIPENLMKVSIVGDMVVEMDYSTLGVEMSEAEILEARKQLDINLAGSESELSAVEITKDSMVLSGEYEGFFFTMRDVAGLLILALVTLVMTLVTLFFVGALCKAFRDCESPFEEDVIKKMQNLAYALIPWTVVTTISNSISDSVMNHKISLNFTLDLGVVLIVLVVLVLVHIFKYGAVLQQESDETL